MNHQYQGSGQYRVWLADGTQVFLGEEDIKYIHEIPVAGSKLGILSDEKDELESKFDDYKADVRDAVANLREVADS